MRALKEIIVRIDLVLARGFEMLFSLTSVPKALQLSRYFLQPSPRAMPER